MVCTAGSSGVRRPPWEVLPARRPIVQRPRADCEDGPEPGTRTSRKKGLAQGAAIRRHHQTPATFQSEAEGEDNDLEACAHLPEVRVIRIGGRGSGLVGARQKL